MSGRHSARLIEVVRGLADKVRRYREQYRERGLGEENTKASLIDPLLEALGWDIRDPDEVSHEFRPSPKDNPVDYCLRLQRDTRLLIEAKGLGEDMRDRRWIAQTLGYATMAGAKWCVLTDGDEYLIYNATEAVEADLKLFRRIKLSEGRDDEAANVLGLISRDSVEKDILSSLWKSHFVDRRVKSTLRELVDTTDRKLVLLIRRRTADLSPKDIVASLRRLDIRIEAPESPYEPRNPPKPTPQIRKASGKRIEGGIALADLIAAGILSSPLRLFRKYKGQLVEAGVLSDGAVEFQGQRYQTSSAAAEAARKSITGKRLNTNGWTFWQYQSADGKTLTLADARKRFAKSGSKFVEGRAEGAMRRHGPTGSEGQPERRRLRLKFWQGLLSRPQVKGTRHADLSPGEYGWIGAGSGVRGLQFVFAVKQEEGRVELWIDRGAGKTAENKRIFDWLEKRKQEIERAFGGELSWERLEGKQGCRIAHTTTVGGYRSDESKWAAIQDAMIDAMTRLEYALNPHMAGLKAELASEGA
jgi:predicted type IV restriction endonuclease